MGRSRSRFAVALAVVALVPVAAACGGDDEEGAPGAGTGAAEKPTTVTVSGALDLTGPAGYFGEEARHGLEIAVEEINSTDALDGTKVVLDIKDTASDQRQAASLMTAMVRSDDVASVVGPFAASALAAAPIAQRAKRTMVVNGAGSPGIVENGEYIFRSTTPQTTYHHRLSSYLAEQGVKRISLVYNNDVTTNVSLAEDVWPGLAEKDGLEIASSDSFAATATNFASVITKIMSEQPDAVIMNLVGSQHVAFATALQRQGYEGRIGGGTGLSTGTLVPMGKAADGFLYPVDFTSSTDMPVGKRFVEMYQERTDGKLPSLYASGAYDSIQLIVRGLQRTSDYSPEAINAAITEVAAEGFEGAAGELQFEGRDARVPGWLIEWRGGEEHVVAPK